MGRQVMALHPRQDQISGVIDYQLEITFALIARPTDEAVPIGDLPRRCPETQKGEQVVIGIDHIAFLGAGERFVPQVMVAMDEFVVQDRVLGAFHRAKR